METTIPPIPAARLGETVLSLRDLLRREHLGGRLLPLLEQSAREAFLLEQARAMNLRVEDAELQDAADLFRRRRQLLTPAQTQNWLEQRRLSTDDFEAALERDLLLRKLRTNVSQDRVGERFQAQPAAYDRLQLQRLVVAREDLARELLSQITEEGADFTELAQEHSQDRAGRNARRASVVFRCQLAEPFRAALAEATAGAVIGPVAAADGFHLLLVEEVTPGQLDAATTAFVAQGAFNDWLKEGLAAATFSAPLLDLLA